MRKYTYFDIISALISSSCSSWLGSLGHSVLLSLSHGLGQCLHLRCPLGVTTHVLCALPLKPVSKQPVFINMECSGFHRIPLFEGPDRLLFLLLLEKEREILPPASQAVSLSCLAEAFQNLNLLSIHESDLWCPGCFFFFFLSYNIKFHEVPFLFPVHGIFTMH